VRGAAHGGGAASAGAGALSAAEGVATLGQLTGEEPREEAGWEQLEALLEGKPAGPCTIKDLSLSF